jgi:hypothetical protein
LFFIPFPAYGSIPPSVRKFNLSAPPVPRRLVPGNNEGSEPVEKITAAQLKLSVNS